MLDVRFFCSFFYLTTHSFIDYVIHSFSSQQLPYFLIIAASILLLISIIGTGYNEGYGIAVAVVAGVIALLALVASYKVEEKFATVSIVSFWSSLSLVLFMKEDRPPYGFFDSVYLLILLYFYISIQIL